MSELTPEILLRAYGMGIFPMAEHRDDPSVFWVDPKRRGVMPLDRFHLSRSLAIAMRRSPFRLDINRDFDGVVRGCADRVETWINAEISNLYSALHKRGHAHSMEVWEGDELVGGVYGVTLGAAFFGESMFSRATDASKIALVHLVARLIVGGYKLLDAQFHNPHLEQFGLEEITRDSFRARLWRALRVEADFYSMGSRGSSSDGSTSLQAITQMS